MRTPRRLLLAAAVATCTLVTGAAALRADEKPLRQVIDSHVKAAWKEQKITSAGIADDATFLRRIHLDLVGTIPTFEETSQFLTDTDPEKRQKLIDRLLADPRFAQNQADVWDQVMFGRNPPNGDATRKRDRFKDWLVDQFAKNVPYDQWVKNLILAEQEGSELFLVQYRNQPEEATVGISRIFLGTQLQCARCHDHPFEKWTQRDFYGMAGFFVRLVVVEAGGNAKDGKRYMIGEKSSGDVLFSGSVKDQKPGRKGEPVRPKFLGGDELEEPPLPANFKEPDPKSAKLPPPLFSRKAKLAEWVTSFKNDYFARAVANRVWGQFMGRGIVHPVDDLNGKQPPSHPELLETLAQEMIAHRFDLKWYIRELVSSETYQRASIGPGTDASPRWFERARVRPLSAEEMMAAIRVATGFDRTAANPKDLKLPGATTEYFLRYFGEPLDGQGEFQAGLAEHLFLNNSGELRQLMSRKKGNLADTILSSTESWEKKVERLYLSILSRPPRPAEQERFVAYLTADAQAEQRLGEAIWVLVNCAEFRFNR
jgi:hypothetical protein